MNFFLACFFASLFIGEPAIQKDTRQKITANIRVGKNGKEGVLVFAENVASPDGFDSAKLAPIVVEINHDLLPDKLIVVQKRQPLIVKWSDKSEHRMVWASKTDAMPGRPGLPDPKLKQARFSFEKPDLYINLMCAIKSSVNGRVAVIETPYFAISDRNGSFSLVLPSNVKSVNLVFLSPNRKLSRRQVTIEGNAGIEFSFKEGEL